MTKASERPQPLLLHFAADTHALALGKLFPHEPWARMFAEYSLTGAALREPSQKSVDHAAKQLWDVDHIWNKRCTCIFCGMSAREALAKGMEIRCPTRVQNTPDFL